MRYSSMFIAAVLLFLPVEPGTLAPAQLAAQCATGCDSQSSCDGIDSTECGAKCDGTGNCKCEDNDACSPKPKLRPVGLTALDARHLAMGDGPSPVRLMMDCQGNVLGVVHGFGEAPASPGHLALRRPSVRDEARARTAWITVDAVRRPGGRTFR